MALIETLLGCGGVTGDNITILVGSCPLPFLRVSPSESGTLWREVGMLELVGMLEMVGMLDMVGNLKMVGMLDMVGSILKY